MGWCEPLTQMSPPSIVDPFRWRRIHTPWKPCVSDCETFASDLNPVACLILKVMLEDIP